MLFRLFFAYSIVTLEEGKIKHRCVLIWLEVRYAHAMSKPIHRPAKSENLTVGEYVRRAWREVESRRPTKSPSAKLASIREAVKYSFPTGSIEEMNREIELGYQG